MRSPQVRYANGDSIVGGSIEAKARRVNLRTIRRYRDERAYQGKYLRLEGTAYAEITAGPTREYVIGDTLKAELIIAQADKVRMRRVTRGSSTHNIQQCGLRGNVTCVIARPLRPVRESSQRN
jgi:hypothetical protein